MLDGTTRIQHVSNVISHNILLSMCKTFKRRVYFMKNVEILIFSNNWGEKHSVIRLMRLQHIANALKLGSAHMPEQETFSTTGSTDYGCSVRGINSCRLHVFPV